MFRKYVGSVPMSDPRVKWALGRVITEEPQATIASKAYAKYMSLGGQLGYYQFKFQALKYLKTIVHHIERSDL